MVIDSSPLPDDGVASMAEQFARDGYVIARGVFSPKEVTEIREIFAKIHQDGVPGFYEKETERDGVKNPDDPLYKYPRIMMPHRFDKTARDYMLHPKVAGILKALFQNDPVATQSMFYFKPPGARGQALHQDQFYLLIEPGTCIAAWTAIDDCDADNGGMMVVPNSNKLPVACPDTADSDQSYTNHLVKLPKGYKAELVKMKAGDTLFFNGNVIHGSGPNRSADRFRRAFICHYASGNLEKISSGYRPLVRMDGTEYEVEPQNGGGPCGEGWHGATH